MNKGDLLPNYAGLKLERLTFYMVSLWGDSEHFLVCDCKKCVVRDYDCTLKTGVCRPKLIPYDIIKKCNQDSCENGGPAVVIIPTVLSVGCYCHTEDMDNQTTKIDQEEQKQHLAPKKRAFYRRALNRNWDTRDTTPSVPCYFKTNQQANTRKSQHTNDKLNFSFIFNTAWNGRTFKSTSEIK